MVDFSHVHAPVITVFSAPSLGAEPSNTLLYGERVQVLKTEQDWSHIRSLHDNYEGFVRSNLLQKHGDKPHKVAVPVTALFETPNFKASPRHHLYLGSPVTSTQSRENGFIQLTNKGWVFEQHLTAIDHTQPDFTATALQFLHAPYVWGGRSYDGIDCSGLVQISLMAAGIQCPRDTKDQINAFQHMVERKDVKRGDLVFFERHVGIMLDEQRILNATSRHMRVVIENLEDLETAYNGIIGIRRII